MPRPLKLALLVGTIAVAVGVAALSHWERGGHPEIAGIVRATEIRMAPEISGRFGRYLLEPGQTVQAGQPVALLVNPELWAAVGAARAQVEKAKSDRDRVYAG